VQPSRAGGGGGGARAAPGDVAGRGAAGARGLLVGVGREHAGHEVADERLERHGAGDDDGEVGLDQRPVEDGRLDVGGVRARVGERGREQGDADHGDGADAICCGGACVSGAPE